MIDIIFLIIVGFVIGLIIFPHKNGPRDKEKEREDILLCILMKCFFK